MEEKKEEEGKASHDHGDMVVKKSKKDDDNDDMWGNYMKKNKKKKGKNNRKNVAAGKVKYVPDTLKHPMSKLAGLHELEIEVPTAAKDVPACLTAIAAKKATYDGLAAGGKKGKKVRVEKVRLLTCKMVSKGDKEITLNITLL